MRILTKGNGGMRESEGDRDTRNPAREGSNSGSFQLLPPVSPA